MTNKCNISSKCVTEEKSIHNVKTETHIGRLLKVEKLVKFSSYALQYYYMYNPYQC